MTADGTPAERGIDALAFADLLREPLAAARALMELLAAAECPDPGMIGGYLGPALRELGRACELLEDLHVLEDARHAVHHTDELASIDLRELLDAAGLETFRRGAMLPPPELDLAGAGDAPLVVRGHRRTLDRMLRTAIELAADASGDERDEAVGLEVRVASDAELGAVVRLAVGRAGDVRAIADDAVATAGAIGDANEAAPDDETAWHDEAGESGADDGAARFRRLVLSAIARAQGGRIAFDDDAAPAAIRIDLPRATLAAGERAA